MVTSRIPEFYKKSLIERRREIAESAGEDLLLLERVMESGGLSPEEADRIVENVLGTYALPFGLGLNFTINGADRFVPMVVEEPSVIAAASNAAKMVRAGGGFSASMSESLLAAQIELRDVPNVAASVRIIEDQTPRLLEEARAVLSGLVRRGAGPRELVARPLGPHHLVVHLLVDCGDAMGANLVNSAAEAIGPRLAELAGARQGLRILSNLADRRLVRVQAEVPVGALGAGPGWQGEEVAVAIEEASVFAEKDPYRAATHNKGIMNGTDSVVIATGNDYRAVEAGAHAYAAASGTYRPLSTWRLVDGRLRGELCMPLALGIVGGTLKVHRGAQLALRLAGVASASDLCHLAGAAGLASNLAALRALATEGIQRGHMALHARSVAAAAGAKGEEVDDVARLLSRGGTISISEAQRILGDLRAGRQTP